MLYFYCCDKSLRQINLEEFFLAHVFRVPVWPGFFESGVGGVVHNRGDIGSRNQEAEKETPVS